MPAEAVPSAATDAATTDAATNAAAPRAVPPADSERAVITVKVGGVRTGATTVAGLAGVTLRLYDGASAPNAPSVVPRSEAWAVCVSDAAGDCSFSVPATNSGGANRDARFWIKQSAPAAPGTYTNGSLATGSSSPASTVYTVRTGAQLRAGTTYRSTADFMVGTASSGTTSGGVWQTSLTNPAPREDCGLRVALVLDLSGSVSPYIADLRAAAKTFVDALTGTPSTVALFTFAATAPAAGGANLASTPVSTAAGAATVKSRIDTYTTGGGTNWDQGLYQVAAEPAMYDMAVVITDGNPTYYGSTEGSGSSTRFREVENGVFSANAIKAEGTRMVVMGVGAGVSGTPDNLRAISGPTLGSDYYQTSDYAAAGATMRGLALAACTGSVTVVKQLVSSSSTGESTAGATPAGGWTFEARTSASGVGPASQSGTTVAGTGAVNFPLAFSHGAAPAGVTIAETQQPGHSIVTQGGKRAACVDIATGASIPVTNDPANPNAFSVTVASSVAASCRVYNRPPEPVAAITVAKRWIVNGVGYHNGAQPAGLSAGLTLNGTAQAWSSTRAGLAPGPVAIAESTTLTGRELCTVTGSRVTARNGSPMDAALPFAATLAAGTADTFTVTNTVDCGAELTLVKQVRGGSAAPTEWTLGAVGPAGALPGPSVPPALQRRPRRSRRTPGMRS